MAEQDPEHLLFGKSSPMTVITPISAWKRFLLEPILLYLRSRKLAEVKRLRFIHFARWAIIDPSHFGRQASDHRTDMVNRRYFLFSTNYNGPWDQYIDSFSLVRPIRRGINTLWWASVAFSNAFPVRRFKRYIRYHEYPVDAYYAAYPNASIRDVESALVVEARLGQLLQSFPPNGFISYPGFPPVALLLLLLKTAPFVPDPNAPDGPAAALVRQYLNDVAPHASSTRGDRTPQPGPAGPGPMVVQL